jgi:hypothetical protein
MKEAFEDRITRRIKEVLEQYEPEYSPQAWKEFRKHKLRRKFWLIKFLEKYRYWFTGIVITGILIIVFMVKSPSGPEKEAAVIPQSFDSAGSFDSIRRSESFNYPEPQKTEEVSAPEKPVILSSVDSKADAAFGKENISFKYLPVHIIDSLPANYGSNIQIENEIPVNPDSIEKIPAGSDLFRTEGFGDQLNNKPLIPSVIKAVEIPALASRTSDRTRQFKLQLPEFNELSKESKKYNKLEGPNKLTIFYSPEINYCNDSLKTSRISHGFGIIIEGPVRSFISVSAGLSYQSVNFRNTILIKEVPLHMSPPIDHFYISRENIYIDNTTILRRGRYKYIELPVSVDFKLLESTRSRVWLGTGISSMAFLMKNFTSEVIIRRDARVDTARVFRDFSEIVNISPAVWKNIHLLASLNFCLIYRFQFSDRLFLHSAIRYRLYPEPLGYYSMKMNNLNLQVGLGYRFGRED